MRNTLEFAEFVRNARGRRTQEEINELGGPVRQTQSRIERAEAFEITSGMLDMLDRAHKEPPGFFAAILRTGHPVPASFRERRYRDAQFTPILGHHAHTGEERELPRRLQAITGPYGIYPLLGMLNAPQIGTVLVDAHRLTDGADGLAALSLLVHNWIERHGTNAWTTAPELLGHYAYQPLIIDPLSAITTLAQARDLVNRIIIPTMGNAAADTEDLAVTVALTAYLAKSQSVTTYEVLDAFTEIQRSQFTMTDPFEPVRNGIERFFSSGQIPAPYRRPNAEVHRLLASLQRVKSAFTHLEFTDPAAVPFVACPPVTDFAALARSGPALIIYDGRKTPEMPALIASGQANTSGQPDGELLVITPHGIVGIEEQDGHVVVVRADQQLLGPQWPGEGYAGLEIFAPASTHNDHDHDLRPLHRAFLGVFITDDRHSAMPVFLPAE